MNMEMGNSKAERRKRKWTERYSNGKKSVGRELKICFDAKWRITVCGMELNTPANVC